MDVLAFEFSQIQNWIAAGGYVVLFGLLFLCGLGLPLPEDIPLLIAGALAAGGKMDLAVASAAAWCGIIGGDVVLYHLGKKYGLEITRLPFIGKHLTRQRIEKVEAMYQQYGIWVVAIGRMFAGVRGAMVVAAGATRYSFWKFFITDGIAALISGGLFVAIGYWLGHTLKDRIDTVDDVKKWVLIGLLAAAMLVGGWLIWRRLRRTVEAPASKEGSPARIENPRHDEPTHSSGKTL